MPTLTALRTTNSGEPAEYTISSANQFGQLFDDFDRYLDAADQVACFFGGRLYFQGNRSGVVTLPLFIRQLDSYVAEQEAFTPNYLCPAMRLALAIFAPQLHAQFLAKYQAKYTEDEKHLFLEMVLLGCYSAAERQLILEMLRSD